MDLMMRIGKYKVQHL